jgi:hypothetical protein
MIIKKINPKTTNYRGGSKVQKLIKILGSGSNRLIALFENIGQIPAHTIILNICFGVGLFAIETVAINTPLSNLLPLYKDSVFF